MEEKLANLEEKRAKLFKEAEKLSPRKDHTKHELRRAASGEQFYLRERWNIDRASKMPPGLPRFNEMMDPDIREEYQDRMNIHRRSQMSAENIMDEIKGQSRGLAGEIESVVEQIKSVQDALETHKAREKEKAEAPEAPVYGPPRPGERLPGWPEEPELPLDPLTFSDLDAMQRGGMAMLGSTEATSTAVFDAAPQSRDLITGAGTLVADSAEKDNYMCETKS
ncbi:MAG: hypothetical protein HY585_02745 [Candidatus Omnitrophica bacterium]|nr:hypothetical protein [Candidatus Omnitrophota bacterium]